MAKRRGREVLQRAQEGTFDLMPGLDIKGRESWRECARVRAAMLSNGSWWAGVEIYCCMLLPYHPGSHTEQLGLLRLVFSALRS